MSALQSKLKDIEPVNVDQHVQKSDSDSTGDEIQDYDKLNDTQKLQLSERANEIYREQLQYAMDHMESFRSVIQEKDNIIHNLMLRYDWGIITEDSEIPYKEADEINRDELRRKAEALAQATILENFQLREMVDELTETNSNLENELHITLDKYEKCQNDASDNKQITYDDKKQELIKQSCTNLVNFSYDDDNDSNEEKNGYNNINNKISLLVNKEKVSPIGWCDRGHDGLGYAGIGDWEFNTSYVCAGCGEKQGDFYRCKSCANYDKAFHKDKYDDKTESKYLWCGECAREINPQNVQNAIKNNDKIASQVIETLNNNPQIAIDVLTGLKNKNALVHLLNEISVNDGKSRYILYVFDIDGFRLLNEKLGHDGADDIIKGIGHILTGLEQKTADDFHNEQIQIKRCWCFRQGGDEFAIVAEGYLHQTFKQESFYLSFNKEIKALDITISVGMCCAGLGVLTCDDDLSQATDWLSFADKIALYETKNSGKNGIRIYDNFQKKTVKTFDDYQKYDMQSVVTKNNLPSNPFVMKMLKNIYQ